jgi:hypothetical protein
MKTIIGMISCAVVAAAIAACHHDDNPPPTTPSTYTESTTTTTAYQPSYEQTRPVEPPSSTTSDQQTGNPAMNTVGTEENNQEPVVRGAPVTPIDPSLENNEPGASPKPVTGQANAKQTDAKKSDKPSVGDQGNSKAEVKISARIRKSLMASNTLSFGAKNVKIITEGSKVTLRGDVKSEAERKEIVGIAQNTNGVTQVDDQLVVKP